MAEPQHLLFGFLFAVSLFVMMQSGSANEKSHNTPTDPTTIYNNAAPKQVRNLDQEEEYPSRESQQAPATLHQPNYGVGQTMIVKMLYCTSWSYGNYFRELQKAINEQFPEVRVVGGNYPVAPAKQFLSQAIFILQLAGFAFVLFGETLCRQFGVPVPPIYYQLQERKMFVMFGLFFIGNSLSNSFVSTGAFEITVHEGSPDTPGQLLWSKLATGNVPTADYVLQRLQTEFGLQTPGIPERYY